MLKCILIDAYGTLFSTGNGSVKASGEILKNKNSDIPPEEFYKVWKTIHKRNTSSFNPFICEKDIFINDLAELYDRFNITGDASTDVEPMIKSLYGRKAFYDIDAIKSIHLPICIASTSDTEPLMDSVRSNNVTVSKIYSSEMLKEYKPNRRFYQKIIDDLGVKSREVIFIGDSLIDDVYGPQQLGIRACLLNRKNIDVRKTNFRPDYEISSLYQLGGIIESFDNC